MRIRRHVEVEWEGALGTATVILVDGTASNGYGMALLSKHMIQHMILSMRSPILLVLGAPITLMLRVLPAGSSRCVLPAGSSRWNAV